MKNLVLVLILVMLAFGSSAYGQKTGHYPLGSEGLKAATLPPPGKYLRTYVNYYTSNVYRDHERAHILSIGDDTEVDALAIVPRFIWMTDQKILGADYGMDVAMPLVYQDVEFHSLNTPMGSMSLKDNDFCFGDMLVEPVDLGWHFDRFDIGAAFGVWMPTGKYDKNYVASPGKDFWTYMFTFGATYYFDAEKTWHGSVLNRYEIHSYADHTDYRPGQDWVMEWGVGKTINKVWDVGIAGYSTWQMTDDTGDDVLRDEDLHDRVSAIGPEVSLMVPQIMTIFSGRVNFEFSAVDRTEGVNTMLTITKIF